MFHANKVLVCVRNPVDVVISMFNFVATCSQNMSVKDELKYPLELDAIMRNEITVWRDFHNYWISKAKESALPIYFCRYEDLMAKPEREISDVFRFMLGVQDIEGTYVQKRIREVVGIESSSVLYKPRSGKANCNFDKFTKD